MTIRTTLLVPPTACIGTTDTLMLTTPAGFTSLLKGITLRNHGTTARVLELHIHSGSFSPGSGALFFVKSVPGTDTIEGPDFLVIPSEWSLSMRTTTGAGGSSIVTMQASGALLEGIVTELP